MNRLGSPPERTRSMRGDRREDPPARRQHALGQWLCACLFLCWSSFAFALHGSDRIRFRTMAEEAGLPQSSVSAIVQDELGFVWMGTQDGLVRFDGEEVRVLRHERTDPNSLVDSYVQALALTPDQQLWSGSPALGLSRIDLRSMRVFRYYAERGSNQSLAEDGITALTVDRQGRLWVSTRTAGVQLYDAESDQFLPPPFDLPWKRRQRVLIDTQHRGLLVAVDDEVWSWVEGESPSLLFAGNGDPEGVLSAAEDGLDRLWLGTRNAGVLALDAQGQEVARRRRDEPGGLLDDGVLRLMLDAGGRLWVGTASGLCLFDGDKDHSPAQCWDHHPADPWALPGNRVTALMEGRDGLIWVGTWTGGAAIHNPVDESFISSHSDADDPKALPTQAVSSIAEASEGGLWLALIDGGGLVRFEPERGVLERPAERHPELAKLLPTAVLSDGPELWVGTVNDGLLRRAAADGPFQWFRPDPAQQGSVAGRGVQTLYRDRQGTLWVGYLRDGLDALCAGCTEFKHYAHDPARENSLSGASINDVLQTADGQLWLAVRRGGLNRLDPETGQVDRYILHSDDGSVVFTASCLFEDRSGRLWIGSQGYGVLLANRDSTGAVTGFEVIDSRHGLPADAIGGILQDDAGWLWVSTTAGLAKINPENKSAQSWRPFSRERAPDYFVGSALRASDGRFHFGGVQGMTSFHPAQVQLERAPPGVSIAELFITNRPSLATSGPSEPGVDIGFAQTLWLRDQKDLITVELAADRPLPSRALRFAYRLDPLDEDWQELPQSRRQVTFTRLNPGDYRLRLKARLNGRDEWGPERSMNLVVASAPWLSPWALLGYLFAVGAIITWAGLYGRRLWRERQRASQDLARSEELLKQSLWGSRGELWDADIVSGRVQRENRLPHLKLDRHGHGNHLASMRPYVHEDDRNAFDAAFGEVVAGRTEYFEISYRTLDDQEQWRWMLSRGKVVERGPRGRAIRLVGTTFDITEVRAQEDALRESQARLRMALWGSRDELWDLDVPANRLHRENPLPALALPVDLQFERADQYLEHIHPADRDSFRHALRDHIRGDSSDFECSYRMIDREERWIWLLSRGRAVSRDEQGRALRLVGTNRDINDIKRAEAQLKLLNEELEQRVSQRTSELEAAVSDLSATLEQLTQAQNQLIDAEKMAALGNLVAGVAHDINTPLGIGVTAASHLQGEVRELAEHLQRGDLTKRRLSDFVQRSERGTELILGNLSHASNLVRSFKQVAVDQSSEQRREIDLRIYLEEVLRSLHPTLARSAVKIELECPDGLVLDTFPGAIYQIVVNLVLNALTHAFEPAQEGRVLIHAQAIAEDVRIQVIDNGRGMEDGIRKRVFEPFFTTRRGQGGSGLGLHIVYNLTHELLGGQISCQSQPGQGCEFSLQFPRKVAASGDAGA